MTRYRALVAYDGRKYCGYQRQKSDQPTVQAELERVLGELDRRPVTVTAAGRTDTGVHARGQVISFNLTIWRHSADALQNALNSYLPQDIAVREVEKAAVDFHPRFDAKRRFYRYAIYNAAVHDPLLRWQSWHVRKPLNLDLLNAASAALVGEHDFATFGTPPQGDNTVRTVFRAEWHRQHLLLFFEIEGNAFLRRMVRSIVGSLRLVGDGRWTPQMLTEALAARDRSRAGQTAPAHGLVLESVFYE